MAHPILFSTLFSIYFSGAMFLVFLVKSHWHPFAPLLTLPVLVPVSLGVVYWAIRRESE
jgi:uncharacterized membrane-anchored protein